ncbi:MAG: phosphoribosylaminoimidazolesuccinocarboxamide synthase [Chloroflexota bacterium]|nr:phosphoribosylaminoimidazolesuccinocarboxamide synthase [Chloroflexota bacterium]
MSTAIGSSATGAGLRETQLTGLAPFAQGKVRDLYAVGDDRLLIVATDRISAFDAVLPTPIPDKGKVLNQLSAYWFRDTAHVVPNHLLTNRVDEYPAVLQGYGDILQGRSMLVRRTRRIDVECVARGYIAGSAWSEYRRQGTACGISLPPGLVESEALPEPIFTPATKAASGHDENISFERLAEIVGRPLAELLRKATLAVYTYAAAQALTKGVIIADTKMEFGLCPPVDQDREAEEWAQFGVVAGIEHEGRAVRNAQDGAEGALILIDELLTPDSSRFWEASTYRPGTTPPSYDKQFVRDYLEGTGWDKEPPAPALPPEIVAQTRARYLDALRRLSGHDLDADLGRGRLPKQ